MRSTLTLIFFLLATTVLMAQPGDPGGGGNPTVPISGIEFLIGGGLLMGLRRFLRNREK